MEFPRIFKEVERKFSDNNGQNICRLFHVLEKLLFTTSESELDYYHQKVIVPDSSQVVERLKT